MPYSACISLGIVYVHSIPAEDLKCLPHTLLYSACYTHTEALAHVA